MEEVQQFFSETFLDVSRRALLSPYLADMHNSDTDIYLELYAYFKKRAIQQRREKAICISRESGVKLLRHVLLSNLVGQTNPLTKAVKASPSWLAYNPQRPLDHTVYPTITQRSLKDQLQLHKVNTESFAEALELCRRVDQKSGAGEPATFGTVNLIVFVAVALTLVPAGSVEEVVGQLLGMCAEAEVPLPLIVHIVNVWQLLDSQNQASLARVRDALHTETKERTEAGALMYLVAEGAPSLARACLSDVPQMFMQGQIRAAKPQPSSQPTKSESASRYTPHPQPAPASSFRPPVVVRYSEDDTGVAEAPAPRDADRESTTSSDDDEDDDGKEFWAQLAS